MKHLKRIIIPAVITALFIIPVIAAKGGLMGKWKIAMSLPRLHKAEALWFKGNIGLVFGHYRSLDDLLNKDIVAGMKKKQAFILRTVNNGKSWEKVYDGAGEVSRVSYRKDGSILYALGRKYRSNGTWQAFLLQSSNLGESWSALETPNDSIIGVDFSNKKTGYAWSENALLKTTDGAKSWSKINYPLKVTLSGPQPVVGLNGGLWTISNNKLIKIESNSKIIEIDVPNALKVDSIDVSGDNTLWLVGRAQQGNTKRTKVYKHSEASFEKIADLDYFLPRAFCAGQKRIFILGSDMSEVPPRKILMHSKNMGKSWKREEPKISDAMGPVYFEDENVIWVYGSEDRIQKRKF